MSKYDPLRRHLERLPRGDTVLSFSEIEDILRFRLPPSAHEHNAWWANERGSHVQAKAWMDAGWQVWQVQRSQEKVYFRPAAHAPVGVSDIETPYVEDEGVISIPRSSLRGSAMRLLEDYREGNGGTIAEAIAAVLNGMAIERRRQLLERFPLGGSPSGADSAALIREDRDAR